MFTLLVALEFTVNLIFEINLLEPNHRHNASVYLLREEVDSSQSR